MKNNDLNSRDKSNRVTIDYWKCSCGKTNSNHSELCVKCGKERPLLCTMEKISY